MIEIRVCKIRGKCPVYEVGDGMVVDGRTIVLDKTDALCMHALSTLHHHVVALEKGVEPIKLELSRGKERAHMQCVDPGAPYAEGRTAIPECHKIGRGLNQ